MTTDSVFDLSWRPVVNPADPLLPEQPIVSIAAGNYNKGELIIVNWGSFSCGAPTLVESVRQAIQIGFTTFARDGRPDLGSVTWPVYTTATDRNIAFKVPVTEGVGLSKADCDSWYPSAPYNSVRSGLRK